jgi:hypothetical protein
MSLKQHITSFIIFSVLVIIINLLITGIVTFYAGSLLILDFVSKGIYKALGITLVVYMLAVIGKDNLKSLRELTTLAFIASIISIAIFFTPLFLY